MIKSIELKNFQSHKKSSLNFSKHVNAIIGKTDSGKTSIIRALYWTLMNKPGGQSFISTFSSKKDQTSVNLNINDGEVIRIKAKSLNMYIVNQTEFTSFGAHPPDEVLETSHVDALNFQRQMDAPFILSMSAGEVSRYFNDIIGLDVIDSSLSESIRAEREAEKDLKQAKEDLEEGEKALKEHDWLDEAKELFREAKIMWKRIDKKEAKLTELRLIHHRIEPAKKALKAFKFIDNIEDLVTKSKLIDKDTIKKEYALDLVYALKRKIEEHQETLRFVNTELITMEEELEKSFPEVCPLCGGEVKHD